MEGPRTLLPHEFESLDHLVDSVFFDSKYGEMRRRFPHFLCEDNRENLFVFADGGKVVSHAGMMYRWASIGGCTVRVACIGSVATYAQQRGQRLASKLMEFAWDKAQNDGADFMLISGDLNIYLRAGAAIIGCLDGTVVDPDAARRLAKPNVTIRPFQEDDVPFCAQAYRTKPTRFIRPVDDWKALISCNFAIRGAARVHVIERDGVPVAYMACNTPDKNGQVRVMEYAGEMIAVAAAIPLILDELNGASLRIDVEADDSYLSALLAQCGAAITPAPAEGSIRMVNAPQFIERMRPWFEERVGIAEASTIKCTTEGPATVFQAGDDRFATDDPATAVKFLFGTPEGHIEAEGLLKKAFPLPVLSFGLNFV